MQIARTPAWSRTAVVALIAAWLVTADLDGQGLSISGVSGVWNHNSTLTITGTAFGTKSTARPVIWDDMTGTSITTLYSGGWPDAYTGGNATYNIAYRAAHRGVAMPHARIAKYITGCACTSNDGYNAGYNVMLWKTVTYAPGLKLYWSFYYRDDPLWSEPSNNKMWDWSFGGEPYDLPENWYAERKPDGGLSWHLNDDRTNIPRNLDQGKDWWGQAGAVDLKANWVKLEYYATLTSASSGHFSVVQNGVELFSYDGHTDNMAGTSRTSAIGGYKGTYNTNSWRYFADVYYDTSWAHVILGNRSTYSTSTVREAQIATAWSNSSITISANLGTFSSGQTAYLYVMDSNRTVNQQGLPITVGSGSSAPAAPTNLRIQ